MRSPALFVRYATNLIAPDSVTSIPLASCIFPLLVSIGAGIADVESGSPLAVILKEFRGSAGSGIIPPFPLIVRAFLAVTSLLFAQA